MTVASLLARAIDRVPRRAAVLLLASGFVLAALASQVMTWFSSLSGNEASLFESQLSFSAGFLRHQYEGIIAAGGMDYYRAVIQLDYAFMTGYACISIAVAILVSRMHPAGSRWHTSGHVFAVVAPAGAVLDAIENAFILVMIADPVSFAAWIALAHSAFALVKWIVLFVSMGWAGACAVASLVRKRGLAGHRVITQL